MSRRKRRLKVARSLKPAPHAITDTGSARAQPLRSPIEPRMQDILMRCRAGHLLECAQKMIGTHRRFPGEGIESKVFIGLRLDPPHGHGNASFIAHTRSAG